MKKVLIPLFALLLPASYPVQKPSAVVENARRPHGEPIRHQTREPEETTLYFPDFVDGGGWSVQLALSNVDPDAAAEVVVEVHGEDGEPILDLFDAGLTFEIPALGSRVLRSPGTGAIRRGWIQVRTGTDPVSGLLTYQEGTTGIEVSVEPAELGERFALFVEESDDVGAGVAVFKPEASPGIELRVRDEEGNDPLEGAFASRGNFHQMARTLPEWFTAEGIDRRFLRDFRGLLFLRSEDGSSFAPLGLRFGKRNQSLSSVPAIRDETREAMQKTLYFPDYVDGSGWSVQLALSNIDAESAAVSVEVLDEDGRPVSDLFDAESRFRIPPLGSRVLKSAGAGAIRRGWIEVESDSAAVSGLLTYRQAGTGVEVSVKPVELGNQFALFVEESPAIGAGVAIFKPDAAPKIELRVRDEEGNDPLAGAFIPRGGFLQLARTLPEWIGAGGVDTRFPSDFRGLLFLRSEDDSQFAPLGLRFGKASHSLSSVPAIRIADGDGIGGGRVPPPTAALSVAPGLINWGESATLTWSSTHAVSVEITPDIGAVAAAGSRKVSPRATTTYRITARGGDGRTQTASVTVRVVVSERAALTALYKFTGGTNWTSSGNWGTARPLGEWHGVSVDGQGRVTGLVLKGNGLSGEFPPELGALAHLRTLDLRDNALTGPIPVELGALANLTTLGLAENRLTGPIPGELGGLANLTYLALNSNQLIGSIPPQLGSLAQLTTLSLRGNTLTNPIPTELASLALLTALDLGDNALTGPIPAELGALANLERLLLHGNFLEGTIPPELGALSKLTILGLDNNDLTGPIPPQLGSLSNLHSLQLHYNGLTGPIPPELGALSMLTNFWLGANVLSGPIPAEFGALANLEHLILSNNRLTGSIPAEMGSLTKLKRLTMRSNRLQGPLPRTFLELNLDLLWFDSNEDICVPATADFLTWSEGIESYLGGPFCNVSDRAVLEAFFEIAGGSGWTNSRRWRGEGPLEEWHGVSVDSLGRVTALDLSGNGLEGRVPGNLALLSQLSVLRIGGNSLSGRLPLSLSTLPSLREFHYPDTDLCVPAVDSFRAWLEAVPSHDGTAVDCPAPSDRDRLVALYDAAGGPGWHTSENWLTDRPLGEWHGVEADGDGRVTRLGLSYNNLTGTIAPEIGSLTNLNFLDLNGNRLAGPLPKELGQLANLGFMTLIRNELTGGILAELGALSNLGFLELEGNRLTGSIPSELGALSSLGYLSLGGNRLTGAIPAELASLTALHNLYLGNNALTGSIPPELGGLVDLKNLWLEGNDLTGSIPSDLGRLANLENLRLEGNDLTGAIPSELGALTNLQSLGLQDNGLTGPIPAGWGSLAELRYLNLGNNALTGPIPSDLGRLANLENLRLEGNALAGSVPPELGRLASLVRLRLEDNELTGTLPPEFGGLENLRSVVLARNGGMSGALPARLADLGRLEEFLAADTNLCAPSDAGFLNWLSGVPRRRVDTCGAEAPPAVVLAQAVQSRERPVPLVAGEEALLRVFVTSSRESGKHLPPVRATFYRNGVKTHLVDIPGKPVPIPMEIKEEDLNVSANATIPGSVVQPGLELVIDVDPQGTLGTDSGVAKRIPGSGRLAVDVRTMPVFELTLIPFLWTPSPDSSVEEAITSMAQDPGGHPLLNETRDFLPINELDVKAHAPVWSSTNYIFALLNQTEMIRVMEGGSGHYMGMMGQVTGGASGTATLPGWSTFSRLRPLTMAHELGHNLNLYHAPCGNPSFLEPSYPGNDGKIGAWGYDFNEPGRLLPPVWPDLMSYCRLASRWIGEYHFTNALRYRLHTAGGGEVSSLVASPAKSLLLWGSAGADGTPFLEPAFVVEAPAALPRSDGEFEIAGRDADGEELFSLSFAMPAVADGDGSSSFVFALPVQPGWAEELASITLSGTGGSVRLDEGTDRPVTILRDSGTGEIRGILRGSAGGSGSRDDAVSALASEPGMEVLTSRGIPEAEDWRQ